MLDTSIQSRNEVKVTGILEELDVQTRTDSQNRKYISAKGTVLVDQEINGKVVSSKIPFGSFAYEKTKDGKNSKLYEAMIKWGENFTSLVSCPEDHPEQASRVKLGFATVGENIFKSKSDKLIQNQYKIDTKFLNVAPSNDPDEASIEFTGVIVSDPTRIEGKDDLLIKIGIITYNNKINIIDFVAKDDIANKLEINWQKNDTVHGYALIKDCVKVEQVEDTSGFGSIPRSSVKVERELIIVGGTLEPMPEDKTYDIDSIKNSMVKRQEYIKSIKEKENKPASNNSESTEKYDF